MFIVILSLIVAGLFLLRKSSSKTAFVADLILVLVVSFLMALNVISFGWGLFWTIIIGTAVTVLDNDGILA